MHRIISRDGYKECFACGTIAETVSDGHTSEGFGYVDCKPGGYDHPPYLIPYADDAEPPLVETCAAHPYAGCAPDGLDAGIVEAVQHGHPEWSHAVAYGPCTKPSSL